VVADGRRTILVVEDEGVVAEDLQHRLVELGYEVAGWAVSGEDAVRLADETHPDLVLMDIRIRGEIDGIAAARAIRDRIDIPVIFVTAFADSETLGRAKAAEPFGYIVKPFSDRDLETSIELALYKHRLDATLREREQWLATTLSSIDEGVITTDIEGRISYLNPVAEEMTGWTLSEASGLAIDEVFRAVDPASDEPIRIPVADAVQTGQVQVVAKDAMLFSRGGSATPISDAEVTISVAPIRKDDGDPLGTVMVFRDIREKQIAESQRADLLERFKAINVELDDQRSFLSALFESAPFSVAVFDGQFRVRMANRCFKEAFRANGAVDVEVRAGEVLRCSRAMASPGMCGSLEECFGCQIRTPVTEALEGRTTTRQRSTFERQDQGRVHQMTLLVSAVPITHRDESMAMLILEDVTELSGLRDLLKTEKSFAGIVGTSPKIVAIFDTIREVAEVAVAVLIMGESGTGKELVARAIHFESGRAGRPFVPVNCGALPDGLLESELFGHVKGAFTGAVRDRKGRFELADTGTIFLDEIGDLSPAMQVKLLRVLQESSFERVGGEKTVTVEVRVICATNKDLFREVEAGRFRDDLYYRLAVVPIVVPPLRERLVDLPLIAEHILAREAAAAGGRRVFLSDEVISALMAHHWPGNVRELQNALQFAFIKCKGDVIGVGHLPPGMRAARPVEIVPRRATQTLTDEAIAEALRLAGGNRTRAAELLGVSRATFYRHLGDGTTK
jgi:PAS domain S-box-containing protein